MRSAGHRHRRPTSVALTRRDHRRRQVRVLRRRVRSLPARDQRVSVNQSEPVQGAMPWIIAVEVDACGVERAEYLSHRGATERAIMLASAAVDAPGADQAVADNGDDG